VLRRYFEDQQRPCDWAPLHLQPEGGSTAALFGSPRRHHV